MFGRKFERLRSYIQRINSLLPLCLDLLLPRHISLFMTHSYSMHTEFLPGYKKLIGHLRRVTQKGSTWSNDFKNSFQIFETNELYLNIFCIYETTLILNVLFLIVVILLKRTWKTRWKK